MFTLPDAKSEIESVEEKKQKFMVTDYNISRQWQQKYLPNNFSSRMYKDIIKELRTEI